MNTLTIRRATAADDLAVRRLASLDSAFPPTGDLLLAEMGDELWAALSVDTGDAVADPFRPSGDLLEDPQLLDVEHNYSLSKLSAV